MRSGKTDAHVRLHTFANSAKTGLADSDLSSAHKKPPNTGSITGPFLGRLFFPGAT